MASRDSMDCSHQQGPLEKAQPVNICMSSAGSPDQGHLCVWPSVLIQVRDLNSDAEGPLAFTWTSGFSLTWSSEPYIQTRPPKAIWTRGLLTRFHSENELFFILNILLVAQNQGCCVAGRHFRADFECKLQATVHSLSVMLLCSYSNASQ